MLKKEPSNVYAAHGLGLVLAEVPGSTLTPSVSSPRAWTLEAPSSSNLVTLDPGPSQQPGRVDDARKVLSFIREKSPDKPDDALINIAHIHMAQVRNAW